MSKVYAVNSDDFMGAPRRDRRFAVGEEIVQSQTIKTLRHLSFDTVSSIQFCVDSAQGLPISTTATRVTARLLSHDRSQIGEPSAPSYCDPDSDASAPKFDLHMGWRGNALHPSITIVCRIDTLEKPTLLPKCIGFAVLKLCVDINGDQPGPDANDARVFLNAGQFLVPIVYGRVPTDGIFSEGLMDKLPHIHDAYLTVRLFDPNVDEAAAVHTPGLQGAAINDIGGGWFPFGGNREYGKFIVDTSVIAALIYAMPYSDEQMRRLPISDSIMEDIKKGKEIGEGEKKIVLRQCAEWMGNIFPALKQKIPLIDPRFMLKYEDKIGVFAALDMLYNMPMRTQLLQSTIEALGSQGLLRKKKYDNHVKGFKAYFRYLPGYVPNAVGKKDSIADMIIDDASLDLELSSQEFNPVFNDDFSRTVGIELSPNACLLVVVTAVDVLTSQKLAMQAMPGLTGAGTSIKPGGGRGGGSSGSRGDGSGGNRGDNSSSSPDRDGRRHEEERAFKLRGLLGTHFGNDDPTTTWWGILPLLVESPFQKRPKSGATRVTMSTNGSAPMGGNMQPAMGMGMGMGGVNIPPAIPNRLNGGPGGNNKYGMNDDTNGMITSNGIANNKNVKFNLWTAEETPGTNTGSLSASSGGPSIAGGGRNKLALGADYGQSSQINAYFVNAGTHQVPLFYGFPPEDMLKSSSPMAWLLSNLSMDRGGDVLQTSSLWSSFFSCLAREESLDAIAAYNIRRGKPSLNLSPGASAFVSLVDPRLRQFSNGSVSRDPTIFVKEETLNRVLKAKFMKYTPGNGGAGSSSSSGKGKTNENRRRDLAYTSFHFNNVRRPELRSYQAAIPANIFCDALIQDMNKKFIHIISEAD